MNEDLSTDGVFGNMFKKLFWYKHRSVKPTPHGLNSSQELEGEQSATHDEMSNRTDPKVNELETFEQYINIGRIGSSFYYN